jgi:hypothetical protein
MRKTFNRHQTPHTRHPAPRNPHPKFSVNRAGVSEVLGDILLVVMSVVMLSTLAVQLLSLPAPTGTLDADTVASFDGQNLTIEHVGGADLKDPFIAIQVGRNYTSPQTFTIGTGHTGGVLTVGENWKKDVVGAGAVGQNDTVRVAIIDTKNNRVLSEQLINKRADYSLLPDIGLTSADISFWRAGAPVDDGANAALSGDIVTINIKVHNYGRVPVTNVKVAASVYMYTSQALGTSNIAALNASGRPDDNSTVSMLWTVNAWGPHTIYVRVVPLINESIFSNNYASRQIRVGPGIVVPDAPDLNITAIYFSNSHPVHGDTVVFYVRIANQGGMPTTASLTYWDRGVELFTDYNISVSAGQLLEVNTVWVPSVGGVHNMSANVSVTFGPPDDADPGNNERTVLIEVLPTIMLVDDDKAGDGSPRDVTTPMKAALNAVAAQYSLYNVGSGDGPRYDSGPAKRRLVDFDLVIWVCGYESSTTLTGNDILSLRDFLDHGGKLWLIGQDIANELTANAFLTNYLHVASKTLDTGVISPLEGVPGNNVTSGMSIPMNMPPWPAGLSDLGDSIVNDTRSVPAFRNTTSNNRYGLIFNASTNSSGPTYTLAFFAFEFSQISSANDRSVITYSMLKWFDCLTKWGRDLALSEEVIGKLNPDFMDEVNITVFLRNNGQDLEPAGADRVLVLFLMDNVPMTPYAVYINDTSLNSSLTTNPVEVPNITGDGGFVRVTMTWLANKVGTHSIRVSVDPFDFIDEVDEDNNEVWGASTAQIMVRYALLVVDDDDSINNRPGGPGYNSTFELMRALDRLGYTATLYVVPNGTASGPGENLMRRFNTVIWLTGQCAPGGTDPLTAQDITNLSGYLSAGDDRGLWLIGQDMFPSGVYGAGSFVYDYLHISTITRGQGMPNPIFGVKGDDIGHGINYTTARTFNPITGGSLAVPRADAQGVTYGNFSNGSFNSVRHSSASLGYRTFYCGWDLSFLAGRGGTSEVEYESEFAFMAMRWLGMPELRIELRVTEMDLFYGNMTPMQNMTPAMGNSYVAKAIISNLGGIRGDTSVRFIDGSTVIGTCFVSVAPGGKTIAEIIWTPLFAGLRTIYVQIDPDSVVPQIMKFNDRTGIGLRSYFFYDDMENGTRNWRHEATILRINGESALEYMDIGNVSSGVASSWNKTQGFVRTTEEYHTMNSSYFMREPGPPVDLVLVFDTSKSMDGTPFHDEQEAARTLVYSLANDSRVAIYHAHSSAIQRKHLTFTPVSTGRDTIDDSIDALNVQAYSELWLTLGEAIQYALDNRGSDRIPAVVMLTDGQDYQGDDTGGNFNKLEEASKGTYCPWTTWGNTQAFANHWGKYFGDAITQGWWYRMNYGGNTAAGLLNSPIPVFTIGLNLEHDANLPAFATTGSVVANQRTFSVNTGDVESGTPEYNLYRISSTSPAGRYFYAPASSDLALVFDQVGQALGSLSLSRGGRNDDDAGDGSRETGDGTDGSNPRPGPRSPAPSVEGGASGRAVNVPGANDLYAITTTFDLRGDSSARLCFWQKYQITMGCSGCVVLVGTSTDNITFNYSYMTPTQSYKGNIKTSITRYDDKWREIRWCWNGISGKGAFSWEYVEVNLNQFCGQQYVRVMFDYIRAAGGGGKGWWIDDVEVKVTRSDQVPVADTSMDQWELVRKGTLLGSGGGDFADAYSGQYAWLCHNPSPSTDYLKAGLDNCLVTIPIDLTNALDATLIAKFKFNINFTEGRPPDGFRVEVSSDTGVTWRPVHFGVRAAWRVSGTEAAGGDGKSFTGVNIGNSWVYSTTMARLNCDLTGWAGSVIQLRFRVVTRADAVNHYETATGWGGFYIDDVTVFGNTTTGGRSAGAGCIEQGAGDEPTDDGYGLDDGAAKEAPVSTVDREQGILNNQQGTTMTDRQQATGSRQQGATSVRPLLPFCLLPAARPSYPCTQFISSDERSAIAIRGGDVE